METYQQFINGALVDSHSTDWIDVENPYTNEVIARAPKGDEEDVNRAVDAAKAAQPAWGKQAPVARATYLKQFAQAIRDNRLRAAAIGLNVDLRLGAIYTPVALVVAALACVVTSCAAGTGQAAPSSAPARRARCRIPPTGSA